VKHDEMVAVVAERAGVSRRYADEIILATLTALGERLTPDETKDLLAQLPKKYQQHVHAVPTPTPMNADEFVARVAELEGERAPSATDARAHVSAVFMTLGEAVNSGELRDIFEQLSDDFQPLFAGEPIEATEPEAVLEELAADVADTFDAMKDRVDEALSVTADVPPVDERVRMAGAINVTVGTVARGVSAVVHSARDRALDLVVFAVDGLEAVTDRIDDAAEALQERVHELVGAAR
jgi:uncharacterized protein (DUF2267 family)